jgi:hypothetical protein
MRYKILSIFLLIALSGGIHAAEPAAAGKLAGVWNIVPGKGTELSMWSNVTLAISAVGQTLEIQRSQRRGRRFQNDTFHFDLSKLFTINTIARWSDSIHVNMTFDSPTRVPMQARLLDDGRLLRIEYELVLSVQQGQADINVLTDYKVSDDGSTLTVTELRSTRDHPLTRTYERTKADK